MDARISLSNIPLQRAHAVKRDGDLGGIANKSRSLFLPAYSRVGACGHRTDYAFFCCGKTLPAGSFFRLLEFGQLAKDCTNRVKSLLSTRGMLLGYSFEPRPNSCALGTANSAEYDYWVFQSTGARTRKNHFDERKQGRLVQNCRLRRPQSGRASFSPPYPRRRLKGALPVGCRGKGFLNKRAGVFRTSPHLLSLILCFYLHSL